ncbi:snRNA-activating protein of 50kDa MW C terminal-domain-containing protein [Zychaea mexicana]|uniref:snRNA-activating protein of 50kDa MW C terminal-domain-containing protein n=1 Tax=Zychaea mexicana TaxID=64656 RepID=UPI0022FE3DF3|nr:snRNA-activating protein of 50kDa MW C terminal-domain-containing protein [Zychaea mexicana]KAI9497546.1 snRNA-activating protein of 50kDa MW C terminal-domain-containing protein [Zychaea mexicana]
MSKIDVGEFKRSHIELIKQQEQHEKAYIDVEMLNAVVDEALFDVECLKSASKFFDDTTLFELLKRYKETEVNSWLRRRIRTEEDQIVTKKPQAKDVMPNRTLLEEDERLLQEMEKNDDVGNHKYINPIVPKRRKFVAQNNAPGALHELYSNYTTLNTQTPYFTPSTTTPTGSLSTSPTVSRQLQQLSSNSSSPSSSSTLLDTEGMSRLTRILHPELVLPGLKPQESNSTSFGEANAAEELEEEEDDFHTAVDRDVTFEQPQDLDNPDIPKTQLTRLYMDMAEQIKTSPLQSLNPAHIVDLLPRQRVPLNYASFNRVKHKINDSKENKKTKKQKKAKGKRAQTDDFSDDDDDDDDDDVDEIGGINGPESEEQEQEIDLTNEVILTIAIYHPRKADRRVREFNVLGSQKLTELRDAIYCMKDFAANRNRKDKETEGAILNTINTKLSASYLFIEDVFYVDTRAEKAGLDAEPDYSEPIRKWVMENERYKQEGLAEYTRQSMEDVTFEELQIRINHPYQFLHQDGCQHVIMVRDVRMQCSQDPKKRSEYPYTTFNSQYMRFKCSMCSVYPAEFMTTDDMMSGSSPCFFCRKCYGPFHFDKDGKQMFPFSVSEYFGTY